MSIINVTEKEFEQLVQTEKIVLIDFWATWCGPCRMVAPIIEKVAQKYNGKVVVAKVNIDQEPTLARIYNIKSIPTVLLFENGKLVQKEVGAHSQAVYEKMIEKVL